MLVFLPDRGEDYRSAERVGYVPQGAAHDFLARRLIGFGELVILGANEDARHQKRLNFVSVVVVSPSLLQALLHQTVLARCLLLHLRRDGFGLLADGMQPKESRLHAVAWLGQVNANANRRVD